MIHRGQRETSEGVWSSLTSTQTLTSCCEGGMSGKVSLYEEVDVKRLANMKYLIIGECGGDDAGGGGGGGEGEREEKEEELTF